MILDGKKLALKIKTGLNRQIQKTGLRPGLASILVGNNPAPALYISIKEREAKLIGIYFLKFQISPLDSTQNGDFTPRLNSERGFQNKVEIKIINIIKRLNRNPKIHGILVQLPLPKGFNTQKIINTIDPRKDVDGFHPENVRLLMNGKPRFISPPHGAILVLIKVAWNVKHEAGSKAVVFANSKIFAEPLKQLLEKRGIKTQILYNKKITNYGLRAAKKADIIITAKGKPRFITTHMVKRGAIVIDVGTNRFKDKLVGDVDFESVASRASAITPVPGGVGPMTVAMLLKNTVISANRSK